MAFEGWPSEALDFYEGLEADNSKAYWTDNKATYDKLVRAPMAELLVALEPEFGPGRIFRPNRDIRFSADKSPYKTSIAATLERGGYIQLTARGLAAGAGMYVMASDQLDRYRRAVADDVVGTQLERLIADLDRRDIRVTGHEQLKTAPKGYPKDHPRIDLLRNKGVVAWREWPVEPWLETPDAKDREAEFLRTSRPLTEWLTTHVGPSDNPAGRR